MIKVYFRVFETCLVKVLGGVYEGKTYDLFQSQELQVIAQWNKKTASY